MPDRPRALTNARGHRMLKTEWVWPMATTKSPDLEMRGVAQRIAMRFGFVACSTSMSAPSSSADYLCGGKASIVQRGEA